MRVISQDGTMDVPYDYFSLSIASGKYEDVEVAFIYCHNLSSPNGTKLAKYSSREKALKVMELLRETYIGMPIVMQNVDVSEDVAKEFERLNKCGFVVRAENQPSKVDFINNAIFQFPADDEVEV
ncbi:hypothetical protein KE513_00285 [Oscillospiraceae bacterium Marseille-Q3528]|nr:hypothetical protein [Oscillospiraceae bacterium Marseille-Q3528]